MLQVGLRHFDSRTPDWFAGALCSADATRHGLARELCERTGWRNAPGRPCLSAAGAAGARRARGSRAAAARPRSSCPPSRPMTLACLLQDLGPVSPVGGTDDRRLREAMMATHHPPGRAPRRPDAGPPPRHAASGPQPGGRGTSGWSADARAANIRRVICHHRFLPGVRVCGLGSCAWRRSASPTTGRPAVRPVAACTHVGAERLPLPLRRPDCRRARAPRRGVLALESGWRSRRQGDIHSAP